MVRPTVTTMSKENKAVLWSLKKIRRWFTVEGALSLATKACVLGGFDFASTTQFKRLVPPLNPDLGLSVPLV